MKQPIMIIRELVKKYPNDFQLGTVVRSYIDWLYNWKDKEKKSNKEEFKLSDPKL